MSADPENEFFADGITEDVIAHLSKIRSLKVISRTSVMAFRKRQQSLREIGAALGAGMLVEGSVRRSGTGCASSRSWSTRAPTSTSGPRPTTATSTTSSRSRRTSRCQIAAALRAELSLDERARIGRQPTRDLEAYQLYLQGRNQSVKFTPPGSPRASALRAGGRAGPGFALAYVAIAYAMLSSSSAG